MKKGKRYREKRDNIDIAFTVNGAALA